MSYLWVILAFLSVRFSFAGSSNELIVLLLECSEIKKLWPVHNKALKRFEAKYGLYDYEARNGYRYLAVGKLTKFQNSIQTFGSIYEGVNLLQNLSRQFEIDHRFCKYCVESEKEGIYKYDAIDLPDVEAHNEQIQNVIDFIIDNRPSFAIIDKGRSADERSCIWVENGHFYGMGYISTHSGIEEPSEIKNYVTPYRSNNYIMQLINSFAMRYPGKVFKQKTIEV